MRIIAVFALVCFVSAEEELICEIISNNGTHFGWTENVSNCKDCEESKCKTSGKTLPVSWEIQPKICYWSDYRKQCFSGKGLMLPLCIRKLDIELLHRSESGLWL